MLSEDKLIHFGRDSLCQAEGANTRSTVAVAAMSAAHHHHAIGQHFPMGVHATRTEDASHPPAGNASTHYPFLGADGPVFATPVGPLVFLAAVVSSSAA
jgi:hypothetical protein